MQKPVGILNDEILTEKWFSDNNFIKSEIGYWEIESPYGVFSILPDNIFRKGEYIYDVNIMLTHVRCLFLAYDLFKERAERDKNKTKVKKTDYSGYDEFKRKISNTKSRIIKRYLGNNS